MVFFFLLVKILFKLVNVGIFYDFFSSTLFEVYFSVQVMFLHIFLQKEMIACAQDFVKVKGAMLDQ